MKCFDPIIYLILTRIGYVVRALPTLSDSYFEECHADCSLVTANPHDSVHNSSAEMSFFIGDLPNIENTFVVHINC